MCRVCGWGCGICQDVSSIGLLGFRSRFEESWRNGEGRFGMEGGWFGWCSMGDYTFLASELLNIYTVISIYVVRISLIFQFRRYGGIWFWLRKKSTCIFGSENIS